MPAPIVYRSTDTSAPTLSGTTGSLVALLDACLVNGYGSQPAAGWTKAFSGTNAASYLGAAGHYLDVNDNAAGAAGAQEANVRGYEAMTAVATGTGPFPTTSQQASPGLYVRKSATADATARAWLLSADDKTFHLFVLTGDTAGRYRSFSFGQFYSFKTGDTYRSVILGHTASGGTSSTGLDCSSFSSTNGTNIAGEFMPRVAGGTGTSTAAGLYGVSTSLNVSNGFNTQTNIDSRIYLSRLFVNDTAGATSLRGFLRGVYQVLTNWSALADGDTFSGATGTDFAGRSFILLKTAANFIYAIETTAWDSSS